MNIIMFFIGLILGYFFASYITISYYKKKGFEFKENMDKAVKNISENLSKNNKWFDKKKEERDKKYMEKQLLNKLKMENDIKKADKETLEKLKKNNLIKGKK